VYRITESTPSGGRSTKLIGTVGGGAAAGLWRTSSYYVVVMRPCSCPLYRAACCRRGLRGRRAADCRPRLLCRPFRAGCLRQAVRRVRRRLARVPCGRTLSGGQRILCECRSSAQDSECHNQRFHDWRSFICCGLRKTRSRTAFSGAGCFCQQRRCQAVRRNG